MEVSRCRMWLFGERIRRFTGEWDSLSREETRRSLGMVSKIRREQLMVEGKTNPPLSMGKVIITSSKKSPQMHIDRPWGYKHPCVLLT